MTYVDPLSRNPVVGNTLGVYVIFLTDDDRLLVAQETDSDISSIKRICSPRPVDDRY